MHASTAKFVLRLPSALHLQAVDKARDSNTSLNQVCVDSIRQYLHTKSSPSFQNNSEFTEILQSLINSSLPVLGLVLFGSVARGEGRENSDIDLLIVLKPKYPLTRKLYELWDSHINNPKLSPQFVSLPVDPLEAGSLWYECAIDGILIWEKNFQVSRLLGKIRTLLTEGKIMRVVNHGHPYWVKNAK